MISLFPLTALAFLFAFLILSPMSVSAHSVNVNVNVELDRESDHHGDHHHHSNHQSHHDNQHQQGTSFSSLSSQTNSAHVSSDSDFLGISSSTLRSLPPSSVSLILRNQFGHCEEKKTNRKGFCVPLGGCVRGSVIDSPVAPCGTHSDANIHCCSDDRDYALHLPSTSDEWEIKFDLWTQMHNKKYSKESHSEIYKKRFSIWQKNVININQHNSDHFHQGQHSFSMAINSKTDLTIKEMGVSKTAYHSKHLVSPKAPSAPSHSNSRKLLSQSDVHPINLKKKVVPSPTPIHLHPAPKPSPISSTPVAPIGTPLTLPSLIGTGICTRSFAACVKWGVSLGFSVCGPDHMNMGCISNDQFYQLAHNPTSVYKGLSINWRDHNGKNYLSPVKDQSGCGSCFLFSATAVMESRLAIAGILPLPVPTLSTQHYLNCNPYNAKCKGGYYWDVFTWSTMSGMCSEADAPYTSGNNPIANVTCDAVPCKSVFTPPFTEESLMESIHTAYPTETLKTPFTSLQLNGNAFGPAAMSAALLSGPISITMDVGAAWSSYSGGIFSPVKCDADQTQVHAMTIIAEGVDVDTSVPYWVIQNSWNFDWGESGLARVAKGQNVCNLENNVASYPILQNPISPGSATCRYGQTAGVGHCTTHTICMSMQFFSIVNSDCGDSFYNVCCAPLSQVILAAGSPFGTQPPMSLL